MALKELGLFNPICKNRQILCFFYVQIFRIVFVGLKYLNISEYFEYLRYSLILKIFTYISGKGLNWSLI